MPLSPMRAEIFQRLVDVIDVIRSQASEDILVLVVAHVQAFECLDVLEVVLGTEHGLSPHSPGVDTVVAILLVPGPLPVGVVCRVPVDDPHLDT